MRGPEPSKDTAKRLADLGLLEACLGRVVRGGRLWVVRSCQPHSGGLGGQEASCHVAEPNSDRAGFGMAGSAPQGGSHKCAEAQASREHGVRPFSGFDTSTFAPKCMRLRFGVFDGDRFGSGSKNATTKLLRNELNRMLQFSSHA